MFNALSHIFNILKHHFEHTLTIPMEPIHKSPYIPCDGTLLHYFHKVVTLDHHVHCGQEATSSTFRLDHIDKLQEIQGSNNGHKVYGS